MHTPSFPVIRRQFLCRLGASAAALFAIPVALRGSSVVVSPRADGLIEVWFAELLVGHLDPKTSSFSAVRPDRAEAGQTEMKV